MTLFGMFRFSAYFLRACPPFVWSYRAMCVLAFMVSISLGLLSCPGNEESLEGTLCVPRTDIENLEEASEEAPSGKDAPTLKRYSDSFSVTGRVLSNHGKLDPINQLKSVGCGNLVDGVLLVQFIQRTDFCITAYKNFAKAIKDNNLVCVE